jgi:hypothetical protein
MRFLFTLCLLTLLCTCASAQIEELRLTESVYFASAGHEPNAQELDKLASFANTLGSYASYTLKIEAFTDEKGTETYNKVLAERRANAITSALARQNIVPATAEVLSYGEQRARQNTTNDTERQNDRRVDLVATVTRWEDAATALNQARADQLQTIIITDPTSRQTLAGNKGGVFVVEANSLLRADGSTAQGPVSVALIEAYDLSDMLIAGLTTTAAGKRLVTGGMISLTATDADGEPLELRSGASIIASTPTNDFDEQMRIFSGAGHDENGTPSDWALTTEGVVANPDALFASLGPMPSMAFFRREAEVNMGRIMYNWRKANPEPKAPRFENVDHNFLSRKPVAPVAEEIVYEPKGLSGLFTSKAKKEAETKKLRQKAEETYLRRSKRFDRAVVHQKGMPARNESLKAQYETDQKDWQQRFDTMKNSLVSKETIRLRAKAEEYRKKVLAIRAARAAAMGEKLAGLKDLTGQQGNISRYFFNVNNLGWTNIDIYYSEKEEDVELLAKVPNSTREATVVLIPSDRRSVIRYQPSTDAEMWTRGGIPRGVSYHVIAYQVIEGKLVMAHQFVDEASSAATTLTYEPVAIMDLKDKIAGILGS